MHRLVPRAALTLAVTLAWAPARPAPAADGAPTYHRLRRVEVVDQHGFERPMPALSLLVPVDWKFGGAVEYARQVGCVADLVRATFRAESPDGRTAIEALPGAFWNWSDDANLRQAAEASNRQAAQLGGRGCDLRPAASARDHLTRVVLPRWRKGAEVVGVEPIPKVDEALRARLRTAQAQATQAGLPVRLKADHARARIRYAVGGRAVEEWVTAVVFVRASPMPAFDYRTGGMRQATWYDCSAELVFGLRAPAGALEADEKLFELVLSTLRVDPEWQARVTRVTGNMMAAQSKGARDRSRIISESNEAIGRTIREGYQDRQRRQDAAAERFSQTLRGVQTFQDPGTGERVELGNQYGRAWVSGNGEYVLSDSQSFDPNAALRGSWTELKPVEPGRAR